MILSLFFQVHKVIPGTLADRDGRIQKGDRVLSINGKSTKGVTHREALSILKVIYIFYQNHGSQNCKAPSVGWKNNYPGLFRDYGFVFFDLGFPEISQNFSSLSSLKKLLFGNFMSFHEI